MTDIPLKAQVECADGPCGKSIAIIANPVAQQMTHLVVQDPDARERLVPVDQIAESTHDLIRLSCTTEELAAMEPFTETHYVKAESSEYFGAYYGYYGGGVYGYEMPYATYAVDQVPVLEERIPPGELAIHRWADVEATDGHIGTVGEFLIEPESGHITHLVLMEGHLWGKKELVLPISVIDRIEGDTVFLKLDKAAVEQLPAIPIKRHRHKDVTMDETEHVELVARVFDDQAKATEALEYVEELHQRHIIKILNAAVLVKGEDGTISVQDKKEMEPKKGRLLGAITGGLIGLVGGPVGVVVGALTGAATGGLAARWIDMGFSDKFLDGVQEHMQPGNSVLIVLVEHHWAQPMSESLADTGGLVFQQTLTDELANELVKASKVEE